MVGFLLLFLTPFLDCSICLVTAESRTNFKLRYFEILYVDPSLKFSVNITKKNERDYVSYDLVTPIPIDQHIGAAVLIESVFYNSTVVPLFTVREKYFCQAANKFLGEFWYSILRAGGITPKVCPIRKGRYYGHHIYLDYQAITLQTFPFGTLRFTTHIISDSNPNHDLIRTLGEVENVPN